MKGLTFRGMYVAPILAGTKTSTIRRPRSGLPNAGEQFRLINRYDRPPFATATAFQVVDVRADELTEDDARTDGFASLAELMAVLDAMAADGPDALPGMRVWRIIRFTLDNPTVGMLPSAT